MEACQCENIGESQTHHTTIMNSTYTQIIYCMPIIRNVRLCQIDHINRTITQLERSHWGCGGGRVSVLTTKMYSKSDSS